MVTGVVQKMKMSDPLKIRVHSGDGDGGGDRVEVSQTIISESLITQLHHYPPIP